MLSDGDAEVLAQGCDALRRDVERPVVRAPPHPAVTERCIRERGAEPACEMRPPLAPVEARAGKDALSDPRTLDVDPDLREKGGAVLAEVEGAVPRAEQVAGDERIRDRDAEPSGEM